MRCWSSSSFIIWNWHFGGIPHSGAYTHRNHPHWSGESHAINHPHCCGKNQPKASCGTTPWPAQLPPIPWVWRQIQTRVHVYSCWEIQLLISSFWQLQNEDSWLLAIPNMESVASWSLSGDISCSREGIASTYPYLSQPACLSAVGLGLPLATVFLMDPCVRNPTPSWTLRKQKKKGGFHHGGTPKMVGL